jgi:hypothetical protein
VHVGRIQDASGISHKELARWKGSFMKTSARNLVMAFAIIGIGVAICVVGIYVGDTDDAPGASLIGILLMIGAVVLGVRIARRKI